MRRTYQVAYLAIFLHFLRKIAAKVIPSRDVKYMVCAIQPNYFIEDEGRILDKVLFVVLASKSQFVTADYTDPSPVWTTIAMPVDKLARYAAENGIESRYVNSLHDWASVNLRGDTQAVKYVQKRLRGLSQGMKAKFPDHSQDIAEVIKIIRKRIE